METQKLTKKETSFCNIVDIIERNPLTKLSAKYQNKLLNKIKNNFTEAQQRLFISSFYCYLNYNQTADFIVDLDNIWNWLGFSQKVHAKTSMEKHFIINKDYKVLLSRLQEQKKGRGGQNKETIIMTDVNDFVDARHPQNRNLNLQIKTITQTSTQ